MSLKTIIATLIIEPIYLVLESVFTFIYGLTGSYVIAFFGSCIPVALLFLPSVVCLERLFKRFSKKKYQKKNKGKILTALSRFLSDKVLFYIKNIFAVVGIILYDAVLLYVTKDFFAGFQSLSGVQLKGILDLSTQDSLLPLFGKTFNVIPVVFTLLNLASSVLCSKRCSFSYSLPAYALSIAVFVYSYNANSAFTLCLLIASMVIFAKSVVDCFKQREFITAVLMSLFGIFAACYFTFFYGDPTRKMKLFYLAVGVAFQLPLLFIVIEKLSEKIKKKSKKKIRGKATVFFSGCLFLFVLNGICIPSLVISSSPQDFVDIYYYHDPSLYIVSSAALSCGVFIIWLGALYLMFKQRTRAVMDIVVWVYSGWSAINYAFFGKNLGIMTPALQYENGFDLKLKDQVINFFLLLIIAAVFVFVIIKFKNFVPSVLLICTAAVVAMSVTNIVYINSSVSELKKQADEIQEDEPRFTLSKNGKNVIVLMSDRAISCYIPYFINEKPELLEQFDGFTFYSNTISFGGNTNFAAPPVFGGYEYTPAEMNARDDVLLEDKHNEALKVMPHLFNEAGYDVTVLDPPYAGYQTVPDLSVFDEYSDIKTGITNGFFSNESSKKALIRNNYRNFFCYSIVKTAPLVMQETLYDGAAYNNPDVVFQSITTEGEYKGQIADTVNTATGLDQNFMNWYNVLDNLDYITDIDDCDNDTFLMMYNGTAHSTILLQEPEYVPSMVIDNTAYEAENSDRYTVNGISLIMENKTQYAHYQSNMANILKIGEWLDYLRENGVYDNTKIIIVADHGGITNQIKELEQPQVFDSMAYCPLLMVKDFNSTGFTVCDDFMTNADVPTLAFDGLIDDPVNPFTGNPINSDEKTAHDQYLISSNDWQVDVNNGYQFLPANWHSVHDDIWNKANWKKIATDAVLTYDYKYTGD